MGYWERAAPRGPTGSASWVVRGDRAAGTGGMTRCERGREAPDPEARACQPLLLWGWVHSVPPTSHLRAQPSSPARAWLVPVEGFPSW